MSDKIGPPIQPPSVPMTLYDAKCAEVRAAESQLCRICKVFGGKDARQAPEDEQTIAGMVRVEVAALRAQVERLRAERDALCKYIDDPASSGMICANARAALAADQPAGYFSAGGVEDGLPRYYQPEVRCSQCGAPKDILERTGCPESQSCGRKASVQTAGGK